MLDESVHLPSFNSLMKNAILIRSLLRRAMDRIDNIKCLLLLMILLPLTSSAWNVVGGTEELTQNVRQYLSLKLGAETNWGQDPDLMIVFAQDAMRPYGYMHGTATLDLAHQTMTLMPGQPTIVQSMETRLSPDCIGIQPDPVDIKGTLFRNDVYAALKDHLLIQAHELGYFDAKVSGHVTIDQEEAHVRLAMECRQAYRLQALTVDSPFDDALYRRHASPHLHAPVGTKELLAFDAAIRMHPELGQHEIIDRLNPEDKSVTWEVINRHAPQDYRSIGAGFVSGKGPDLILKYQTVMAPHAHGLNLLSHFSSQNIDGQLVYTIPSWRWLDGTHHVRLFHELFPNRRFNQVSRSELSYRLTRLNPQSQTDYGLSFQYNQDQPEETVIHSHALYPYMQQAFKWSNAQNTWSLTWLAKGGARALGSQFDFIAAEMNLHHRHVWTKDCLSKTQLMLASIAYGGDIQDSWLYRTGGPTTVMGYPVDSIGPGAYLTVLRSGFFYPINETWHLGYWLSLGSASDHLLEDSFFGQALAADMQTPMGAIELSIGKAPSHRLQFAVTLLPL